MRLAPIYLFGSHYAKGWIGLFSVMGPLESLIGTTRCLRRWGSSGLESGCRRETQFSPLGPSKHSLSLNERKLEFWACTLIRLRSPQSDYKHFSFWQRWIWLSSPDCKSIGNVGGGPEKAATRRAFYDWQPNQSLKRTLIQPQVTTFCLIIKCWYWGLLNGSKASRLRRQLILR